MTAAVPLEHLVGINERALPETTDPDRTFRYIDISTVGRGELVSTPEEVRFGDAPSRARRLARPGDTIVSTVRTYLRAVWPVTGVTDDVVVSTGFAVLTPRQIDARYLSWWLRSDIFIEDVVARSVGVSYPAINAVNLGELPVRVPNPAEQRATADYLDTETAHIDALITKKRRMIKLIDEAVAAYRERCFVQRADVTMVPLMHLTDPYRPIVYGIVQAGDHVEGGVPYIKTGDLDGDFEPTQLSRTSAAIDEQYCRARVHPGDIVIAMRASIGAVVEVPVSLPHANLTQGTARIAARPGVDRRWLFQAVQTHVFQEQCQVRAVGSTFRTLNIWDLRRLLVPTVGLVHQSELAERMGRRLAEASRLARSVDRQVRLLRERRQALITSAVTGELHLPGVAA